MTVFLADKLLAKAEAATVNLADNARRVEDCELLGAAWVYIVSRARASAGCGNHGVVRRSAIIFVACYYRVSRMKGVPPGSRAAPFEECPPIFSTRAAFRLGGVNYEADKACIKFYHPVNALERLFPFAQSTSAARERTSRYRGKIHVSLLEAVRSMLPFDRKSGAMFSDPRRISNPRFIIIPFLSSNLAFT